MMRTVLLIAGALVATSALAQSDNRTQLERSLGIPVAEAGLFSAHQLAMIKRLEDRSDLNESERNRRIALIKKGVVPRLGFNF